MINPAFQEGVIFQQGDNKLLDVMKISEDVAVRGKGYGCTIPLFGGRLFVIFDYLTLRKIDPFHASFPDRFN